MAALTRSAKVCFQQTKLHGLSRGERRPQPHRLRIIIRVISMNHHLHGGDARVGGECFDAVAQQRLAANGGVLLGHGATGAAAGSGGDDEGEDAGEWGHNYSFKNFLIL